MSISVNREENKDGTIDLSISIATTQFYNQYWERAIKETGIEIFRENNSFKRSQLEKVIEELKILKIWAEKNLAGKELEYMKGRIDNLIDTIPQVFDRCDTVLYIY